MAALMQRVRADKATGFKAPDVSQFTPPDVKDVVDRVIAAGMKTMYSKDMAEDVKKEIGRDVPVFQKMAESVVGLMLMMDQKAKGGIPVKALFPAALGLLGEAAQILEAAGQPVTQEDYNSAAQLVMVMMAKKLGATDEQIMQSLEQQVGGADEDGAEPMAHEQSEGPQFEAQEEARGGMA